MKVFLTGVTGQLGRVLAQELLDQGYSVCGLVRNSSKQPLTGVQKVVGDLKDPNSFIEDLKSCQYLILAGAAYRDAKISNTELLQVNAESINKLFALLASKYHLIKKAIYISTNAVCDLTTETPKTETSPLGPADFYQFSKLLGEENFLRWTKLLNIPGIVIRPAMIWGQGDERLKKIFEFGTKLLAIKLRGHDSWCHTVTFRDLSKTIIACLKEDKLREGIFLVAGKRAVRFTTLVTLISYLLNKQIYFLNLPSQPLFLLADFLEPLGKLFKFHPPIYNRRLEFFCKNRIFDCAKIEKQLGHVFENDLISEAAEIAREYGYLNSEIPTIKVEKLEVVLLERLNDSVLAYDAYRNLHFIPLGFNYSTDKSLETLVVSPVLKIFRVSELYLNNRKITDSFDL